MRKILLNACKTVALVSLTACMSMTQLTTVSFAAENVDITENVENEKQDTAPAQDVQNTPVQDTAPAQNVQNTPSQDVQSAPAQDVQITSVPEDQNNIEPQAQDPEYTLVSNEDELRAALEKGGAIKLNQDITVEKGYVLVGSATEDADTVLDLDGKTITVTHDTATFAVNNGKNLTVKNGTVTGNQNKEETGAAFECNSGSNVSLQGVTVSNLHNAVSAVDATLSIDNCTFKDNKNVNDGGAIYARNTVFSATGNNLFEGNTAGRNGGAISLYEANKDLVLENMTFVNNASYQGDWGNGGGAIFMHGNGNLDVKESNVFENNYTKASGGAILFAGKDMKINGTYTGNTAETHEGGAIAIIGNFRGDSEANSASLQSGIFTNNKTGYTRDGQANDSYQDWGGGAIFVSDMSSIIVPEKTLVTGNTAGGFGGGLAGCSTGRVFILGDENSLAMVFNNNGGNKDDLHISGEGSMKHDDHTYAATNPVFMENGYDDYFCALNSIVDKSVFGEANVRGSVDQSAISDADSLYVASYVMGITAELVDNDAIEKARQEAVVKIIDNYSYTHGGGILSNGYMIVGNPHAEAAISVGKSLELKASKALFNPEGEQIDLENRVYNFTVTDLDGNKVLSGMNDSTGNIGFTGKISFNQNNFEGSEDNTATYTYLLSEDEVSDINVIRDETQYKLKIQVLKNATTQKVGGETIGLDKYEIKGVEISKIINGVETILDSSSFSFTANDEMHAALIEFLGTNGATFNNMLKPEEPEVLEDPKDPEDPTEPSDPTDPSDPSDPTDPQEPGTFEIPAEPVALSSTPEVFGENRLIDLPEVLGARRGQTSDDSMGNLRIMLIIMVSALAMVMLIQKKKD
ncbi:MAG: hypothetical protein J6O03_08725 [Butyrivibrio sp.]|nr:hypothetical protein [Butyrivibrio sp.]